MLGLMTKKLASGFFDSGPALGLVCAAITCFATGFARAPFATWAMGEVLEINPTRMTLVLREHGSKQTRSLLWNKETRIWSDPIQRRDPGRCLNTSDLPPGTP